MGEGESIGYAMPGKEMDRELPEAEIAILETHGTSLVVAKTLVIFGTACMCVAGVVLASTGRSYRQAAAIQFVPALVALILTSLVPA